jgi:hypothetical protein
VLQFCPEGRMEKGADYGSANAPAMMIAEHCASLMAPA